MATPYLGEIRMFGGNFAPEGWRFCDGSELAIGENEALYQLIGTTYGGDGDVVFALPNLCGRIPVHQGNGYAVGAAGGVEQITLNLNQIPVHTHAFTAIAAQGDQISPAGNLPAESLNVTPYVNNGPNGSMNGAIGPIGSGQPHENCQPFLCVNYIIALSGIFPSPT